MPTRSVDPSFDIRIAQTYLDYQANLVTCNRDFHVFVDLAGLRPTSHYGSCSIRFKP